MLDTINYIGLVVAIPPLIALVYRWIKNIREDLAESERILEIFAGHKVKFKGRKKKTLRNIECFFEYKISLLNDLDKHNSYRVVCEKPVLALTKEELDRVPTIVKEYRETLEKQLGEGYTFEYIIYGDINDNILSDLNKKYPNLKISNNKNLSDIDITIVNTPAHPNECIIGIRPLGKDRFERGCAIKDKNIFDFVSSTFETWQKKTESNNTNGTGVIKAIEGEMNVYNTLLEVIKEAKKGDEIYVTADRAPWGRSKAKNGINNPKYYKLTPDAPPDDLRERYKQKYEYYSTLHKRVLEKEIKLRRLFLLNTDYDIDYLNELLVWIELHVQEIDKKNLHSEYYKLFYTTKPYNRRILYYKPADPSNTPICIIGICAHEEVEMAFYILYLKSKELIKSFEREITYIFGSEFAQRVTSTNLHSIKEYIKSRSENSGGMKNG